MEGNVVEILGLLNMIREVVMPLVQSWRERKKRWKWKLGGNDEEDEGEGDHGLVDGGGRADEANNL